MLVLYIILKYNTKENFQKFDNMLKDIDEEYRTTIINFGKYKLVMFAMAKLMEMKTTEQNKVALYLFNVVKKVENLHKIWYTINIIYYCCSNRKYLFGVILCRNILYFFYSLKHQKGRLKIWVNG